MTPTKGQLRLVSAILFFASSTIFQTVAAPAKSEWVYPGPNGKLVYKTTPAGDKIMDFSSAGYMGGGVALPTVPVKLSIKPSGTDDDTAIIQAAIDEVGAMPVARRISRSCSARARNFRVFEHDLSLNLRRCSSRQRERHEWKHR
jgi:hypothetical protein